MPDGPGAWSGGGDRNTGLSVYALFVRRSPATLIATSFVRVADNPPKAPVHFLERRFGSSPRLATAGADPEHPEISAGPRREAHCLQSPTGNCRRATQRITVPGSVMRI